MATTKAAKKSGAATRSTAKRSPSSTASKAPVTATRTGAGPDVAGGTTLSGQPPALAKETHGGAALKGGPKPGVTPGAGAAADTGPVVEGTGGGLAFERKPSGTRAQPRKEQPTTPERAEIIEGRRLEQEIQKSRVNPATAFSAGAAAESKVGDRIRILRNSATGWEMGTIKYLSEGGHAGAAELDGGETVGLEPGRWEPATGALAAPMLDKRDLKEEGGLIDRNAADRAATEAEAARTAQTSAKPARARARSRTGRK